MKRPSYVVLVLCFILSLSLATNAFAGPSLEDLPIAEINEMLESSRAKSKSDIKLLMNFGLVVPGGDAKSGLKTVTLHEWSYPGSKYHGFSSDSNTFVVGDRKWITWWDVKTLGLKRIVLAESKKYFIFGANRDGSKLVIGKAELDGNKSEFDFASFDGATLKELKEFKYNKNSQKEIFGDFSNANTMWFSLSPDGSRFILAHGKGPMQIWDANSGVMVHENYNYNNKAANPEITFSGDGRFAAITTGGVEKVCSLNPFKALRSDPAKAARPVIISPKGTYMVAGGSYLETPSGERLCGDGKTRPGMGFTYDEEYWLVLYSNGAEFHTTKGKDCAWIKTEGYGKDSQTKKMLGVALPAPDGKHYAMTYYQLPKSGNQLKPMVRIYTWSKPEKASAELVLKVDRGLKLYSGGLKKQGLAILAALVKTDGFALWKKDYSERFAAAGIPLYLVGEMILGASKEMPTLTPYMYSQYAIHACQAKQPFLAAKALAEVNKYAQANAIKADGIGMDMYAAANALSMRVAGRDDDAYTALIESGLGKAMVPVFKRYPDAFAPLLKEPGKLALALDIDQNLLPKPGKEGVKQDYVDLKGNLVKVMPPATPTMNTPQTTPTAQPSKNKKKSSVILD